MTARPLENSGSMKSEACGNRHHRSPITCLDANWLRREAVYGRTALAPAICAAKSGNLPTCFQNSASGGSSG
ncbi:Uncharacterised protein [Mycobacteroides abscessus subsp. abscessus]|nr:Uncharacterised protein [Mycobacteroides abscessus subsp. abscessus]